MSDRNEAVASRLNQLERSNRRMKFVALAAFAVIAMGAAQNNSNVQDLIRARRFQVVDNKGNVIADLGTFGNKNHPALMVYDKKGIVRASVGIDQKSDDSGAAALDHNGVLRAASVAVETAPAKGTSGNFVYDKDGLLRAGVDVDPTNNFIGFFNLDTNGKARIAAGSPIVAGVEFVDLFDGNSILRVGLAADYDSTGGTGLNMFDKGAFFREGLSVDDSNLGGTGNEFLGFSNDVGYPGYFYAPPGEGGAYVTNNADGSARTGALPANAP